METERFSAAEIAGMLDVSAVQANSTQEDVTACAILAAEYRCKAVFCLSCFTEHLKRERERLGASFLVGGTVGYPSGQMSTAMKKAEAALVKEAGVDEVDMMMNIGFLKSGMIAETEADIRAVKEVVAPLPLKVIIEAPLLTPEEIKTAAEIVVRAGADWVKTGTGWTSTGTTSEHLRIIRGVLGDQSSVRLKAAGGVRDLATLLAMRKEYGVERFGVGKSAKKILDEIGASDAK